MLPVSATATNCSRSRKSKCKVGLNRSTRAWVNTHDRQSFGLPLGNPTGQVRRGLTQRYTLASRGERASASRAREHDLARAVRRQLRGIEGRKGIEQRARNTLGGVFH